MKNQKGITLIALIITIIVMLILVGVTINVALNGGIFSRANEAASSMQKESDKEELMAAAFGTVDRRGDLNIDTLTIDGWTKSAAKQDEGGKTYYEFTKTKSGNKFYIYAETGEIVESISNSNTPVPTHQDSDVQLILAMETDMEFLTGLFVGKTVNNNETTGICTDSDGTILRTDGDFAQVDGSEFNNYFELLGAKVFSYNNHNYYIYPSTKDAEILAVGIIGGSSDDDYFDVVIADETNHKAIITGLSDSGFEDLADSEGSNGHLVIPNTVTIDEGTYTVIAIGEGAFNYAGEDPEDTAYITSITFDTQNLKVIKNFAFYNIANLAGTITIPSSVVKIEYDAFKENPGITGVIFSGNNLTTIENLAFSDCTNLTGTLVIPSSVTEIKSGAFYNTGITGVTFSGNNLTEIDMQVFMNCESLTGTVIIPSSVTEIKSGAFYNTNITKLDLSNNEYLTTDDPNYPWGLDESKIYFGE